jgi:twinkle protein
MKISTVKEISTSENLMDQLNNESDVNIKGIFKAKASMNSLKKTFINGKKRGHSTRYNAIDPHFTWKKTFVNCWTGYPNHGKSEIFLQMALAKSLHDKWKWVVFLPENMNSDEDSGELNADEIFDTLIHAYIGKSVDPAYLNRMSIEEYEGAINFIDQHFTVVYPLELHTPEMVLRYLQYVINNEEIDGCVIDPWNKLIHKYVGLLDEYLAMQFSMIKHFAIKNSISFNIIEHPRGGILKNADGSLPVPDAFSLRGGAMWNNAMDCIIGVYRPKYHLDKSNQEVEFHSHKIRNQKLVGIPGVVQLTFDRKTNRYYEPNGNTPLQGIEVEINSQSTSRLPYKDDKDVPY